MCVSDYNNLIWLHMFVTKHLYLIGDVSLEDYWNKVVSALALKCMIKLMYHINGTFGSDFNLVVWRH